MLPLRTIKNKIHASGLNWERETKAYTLRHLIPLRFSNQHCYSIPTTNRRDRHPIIDYIGGDLSAGSPTDTLFIVPKFLANLWNYDLAPLTNLWFEDANKAPPHQKLAWVT